MVSRIRQFSADLVAAWRKWRSDDGSLLAASVAYYAALSFFPVLLILISGFGIALRSTPWGQNAQARLLDLVAEQASPRLADEVARVLENVQATAAVNAPIGLLTLLITAGAIFVHLERAFDRIWGNDIHRRRGIVWAVWHLLFNRLKAFLMLLGLGTLSVVLLVATLVFGALEQRVADLLPMGSGFWRAVEMGISLGLNALVFTAILRILSKGRASTRAAFRGGCLTAVTWEAGRQLLALLLVGEKFSAYGVVGSFIGVMLWVYYANAILFFGAEYTWVITQRHNKEDMSDDALSAPRVAASSAVAAGIGPEPSTAGDS